MKTLLIFIIIIAVAVLTGSWIFDILDGIFGFLSSSCGFLSKVFNFFGWNNGIF